jgi:hypothetical protein
MYSFTLLRVGRPLVLSLYYLNSNILSHLTEFLIWSGKAQSAAACFARDIPVCQARNYLNLDLHKQRQIFNALQCLKRHFPSAVSSFHSNLVSSQTLNIQRVNEMRNNVTPF